MVLHDAHVIKRLEYIEHLEHEIAWHDATLGANHWAAMSHIPPKKVAMLLCQLKPNDQSRKNATQWTTDGLKPEHFVELKQRLEDVDRADPRQRTLRDWHQTVQALGLRYHPWIDRYMEATAPPAPPAPVADTTAPVAAESASDGLEPDSTGPKWGLKSFKRVPGYRWALYQVLRDAHKAGNPCPKARDVLEAWKSSPPADVQVMPDGVKYNDGVGNPKEANLKAIQQAIKGLVKL